MLPCSPRKLLAIAAFSLVSTLAHAIPALQLYIEGGVYDSDTQTWVLDDGFNFRLWAIANIGGPGGTGTFIDDVRLSTAYPSTAGVTIGLTGARIGGTGSYLGFTDPSFAPAAPVSLGPSGCTHAAVVTDGSSPKLGTCASLPAHGIYGPGADWQEFYLGDMGGTSAPADSPIGDFISGFPVPIGTDTAVIHAYDVSVSGLAEGQFVHFDLYNHYEAGNHTRVRFAPFSHDGAGGGTATVPEPSSTLLAGLGLLGMALIAGSRRVASPRRQRLI